MLKHHCIHKANSFNVHNLCKVQHFPSKSFTSKWRELWEKTNWHQSDRSAKRARQTEHPEICTYGFGKRWADFADRRNPSPEVEQVCGFGRDTRPSRALLQRIWHRDLPKVVRLLWYRECGFGDSVDDKIWAVANEVVESILFLDVVTGWMNTVASCMYVTQMIDGNFVSNSISSSGR